MKPKNVLLVEDEACDELLTLKGIRRSGVAVCPSLWNDSPEALRRLLDPLLPVPDLIVLDYRMPRLGGLDLLIALRSNPRTRCVPIVILSSTLSPTQVAECMAQGATACMEKCLIAQEYVEDVALMIRFFLALNILPGGECPPSARASVSAARSPALVGAREGG